MNRPKWIGFAVLLLILAVFGWYVIPAHVTSIWMDWEFTDWISPIASRLCNGNRLYTDGLHSPMPPLPYVLVRLLFPGGATWIEENFLDYGFRSATILLLYCLLARRVGVTLAFAACLVTTPVFLSLGKTMLYDSMAQFLVAATGGFCASLGESQRDSGCIGRDVPAAGRAAILGVTLGLLMLVKQSTALGAVLGVGVTLVLMPAEKAFRCRCLNLFVVGFSATVCICVLSLLFTHFWSFSGMIHDVFLTGTEPKGGPRRMFNNLARYAFYMFKLIACAAAIFWTLCFAQRKTRWTDQWVCLKSLLGLSSGDQNKDQARPGFMLVAGAASVAFALAILLTPPQGECASIFDAISRHSAQVWLMNIGLAACLALAAVVGILEILRRRDGLSSHPLAPFVFVCVGAAIFHNLSVTSFRWAYENNPLIAVALVFLFSLFVAGPKLHKPGRPGLFEIVLSCFVSAVLWVSFFPQLKAVLACTESWPEIPHLAGAKLRPACESMRELVRLVQSQVGPGVNDTVLLLPDDPNVEAWFNRPRPALSSAIIFTDQYWDRYVDADFGALQKNPPKVIVIGPRNYWRPFSKIWHWRKQEGLIRLVDRVQDELLPKEYNAPIEHRILFGGGTDFMDVYVRKDPSASDFSGRK